MKISGLRTEAVFDTSDDDIREAVLKTAAYVESLPAETNVVPFVQNAEAQAK